MIQDVSRFSPPRVALVSGGLSLGGATTFLCNFAGELLRRKIPVEVLSFEKENPLAADFNQFNIPVFSQNHHTTIFEDRLRMILAELRVFKPSVVMTTLSATSFEVLRYLPAGVFRVGVGQSDNQNVYEMMSHYATHMDALAVVSQEMKRRAAMLPEFAKIPVHYLPLGVPMSPEAKVAGIDPLRPLQILYIGRLDREQKRVHLFPQILDQLKKSRIPFDWTIAGNGSERTALESAMQSSPAQTISFSGKISYAQVPELLRAHDVFLLASDHEGLPLSLLEAMGSGLVPVVSDLPSGIPEVVDNSNGILVPVNDVAGYARGMVHLHEHRDEMAAKSAAARARVKTEFSVEAMADRWLDVFPKTVSSNIRWPDRWQIKPFLFAPHSFYFSPPMRFFRRTLIKFRPHG